MTAQSCISSNVERYIILKILRISSIKFNINYLCWKIFIKQFEKYFPAKPILLKLNSQLTDLTLKTRRCWVGVESTQSRFPGKVLYRHLQRQTLNVSSATRSLLCIFRWISSISFNINRLCWRVFFELFSNFLKNIFQHKQFILKLILLIRRNIYS